MRPEDRHSPLSRASHPCSRASSKQRGEQPAAIPPKPSGRGFVRNFANEVNLDPANVVLNYFAQFLPAEPPPARDAVRTWLRAASTRRRTGPDSAPRSRPSVVPPPPPAARAWRRIAPGARRHRHLRRRVEAGRRASHYLAAPLSPERPRFVADAAKPSAPVSVASTVTRPCCDRARRRPAQDLQDRGARRGRRRLKRSAKSSSGSAMGCHIVTINGRQAGPPGANGAVKDPRIMAETTVDGR